MVVHEHQCVHFEVEPLLQLRNQPQKPSVVGLLPEEGSAAVAATDQVVPAVRNQDKQGASHAPPLPCHTPHVNNIDLTPWSSPACMTVSGIRTPDNVQGGPAKMCGEIGAARASAPDGEPAERGDQGPPGRGAEGVGEPGPRAAGALVAVGGGREGWGVASLLRTALLSASERPASQPYHGPGHSPRANECLTSLQPCYSGFGWSSSHSTICSTPAAERLGQSGVCEPPRIVQSTTSPPGG